MHPGCLQIPCHMSEFWELQYMLFTVHFIEATKKKKVITKEGLTLPGLSTLPNSMGIATTDMKTKENHGFLHSNVLWQAKAGRVTVPGLVSSHKESLWLLPAVSCQGPTQWKTMWASEHKHSRQSETGMETHYS